MESLGGDTQAVEVSATKKTGLADLVEAILLQAEVLDLRANPDRSAEGVVIESKLDRGRGPVATVLVNRGTLKRGAIVVAGSAWGKVRALINERDEQVEEAGPSVPVEILGLDRTPEPGEPLAVVESEARARELTEYRERVRREKNVSGPATGASLADMMAKLQDKRLRELPVIIKADVQGSTEAIVGALNALGTDVANDSSSAHFALNQIGATFNVSGAVDEDHRQLSLLQDETSQTLVMIDRLLTEVSDAVQRQTSYVASERGSLTVLANSIKDGELYGGTPGITQASATGGIQLASAGTPLVVIRFDRANVDYQQILYAALSQALQGRPNAGFEVVAVSPTRGTAASVQTTQTASARHAQDVMRSMTNMGVPATRMSVAAATDPGAASSEVRVFVR